MNWRREQKDFYARKNVKMETNKKHNLGVVVYGYAKQNYELTIQKHFSCRGSTMFVKNLFKLHAI